MHLLDAFGPASARLINFNNCWPLDFGLKPTSHSVPALTSHHRIYTVSLGAGSSLFIIALVSYMPGLGFPAFCRGESWAAA